MKATVKYHNDINKINLSIFTEKELNLFFTICFKVKNEGINELDLSFKELKTLSNGDVNSPRFLKSLKTLYTKLITIPFHYIDDDGFGAFVLFNKYYISTKKKIVTIRIAEEFAYLLNDLLGNYTKFDLLEFVSLKSVYSKNMFKLLKQWESIRKKEYNLIELRSFLGVPESYDTNNFNKKVLKPILDELPKYFKNLKLEKIKTGRKVTSLKFTWEKDIRKIKEAEKLEIEITESLNNLIEKAKKNRYLTEILTEKNIYKLTEIYEESQLKKGLKYIYKTVKKDVPNFSYLIKILETGIEEQEVEIKVSKDKKEEVIEKKIEKEEKILKNEIVENPFYLMFLNMPEDVKEPIIEKAKKLFMEEVKINNMNQMYEKFYKASEKMYILKALGGA